MTQDQILPKSIEENFIDWENDVFGFGYGTGEPHTLKALKDFLALTKPKESGTRIYDYAELENQLGPQLAWLMINILNHAGAIDYGTSPRYAWLSPEGQALYDFISDKSVDELEALCTSRTVDSVNCDPQACNCGPRGYVRGRKCPNPFWRGHH